MIISATLTNSLNSNAITVKTQDREKSIKLPSKPEGFGSAVNGGELLFLALATCCCNDLYREAAKRQMIIESLKITVSGRFGAEGEPGRDITYSVQIQAPTHTQEEIAALIVFVDEIAEIHKTLREGVRVALVE